MTLKLAQFCDDPPKYPQNLHTPQKYYFFLKTPKNIEIQNFEPKEMDRAYVCVKISYPPGALPPPSPPTTPLWLKINMCVHACVYI